MLTLDTEQLARQKAETDKRLHRHQQKLAVEEFIAKKEMPVLMDGGLCVSDLAQQMGQPLSCAEMQRRLKLCNSRLIFEVSIRYPDRMGIYIEELPKSVMALDATITKRMICAMPSGMMPERTVRHMKVTRIPDPEIRGHWREVHEMDGVTRGWRTVLYMLLAEKLITRFHVERYFPANAASKNWQLLVN